MSLSSCRMTRRQSASACSSLVDHSSRVSLHPAVQVARCNWSSSPAPLADPTPQPAASPPVLCAPLAPSADQHSAAPLRMIVQSKYVDYIEPSLFGTPTPICIPRTYAPSTIGNVVVFIINTSIIYRALIIQHATPICIPPTSTLSTIGNLIIYIKYINYI